MKAIIVAFLITVSSVLGADTSGVLYFDTPVECHLISQNGISVTNRIYAGETRGIGVQIMEVCPSTNTTIYFSGGMVVTADPNSIFSVNAFDQEVKNQTNSPCLAAFGPHNISLALTRGSFSVTYKSKDENSTCAISTPLAMYQMNEGKFLFQISDAKSLVYVLDGMMTVHGDKSRKDTAKKGSKTITGQIDAEVATTTRPINPAESITIATQTRDLASAAIQFIVIDGRVRGVRMAP